MTELSRRLNRLTSARRHEAGKTRAVVVSVDPDDGLGFRLSGTRQTFWIPIEAGYEVAVHYQMKQIEKRARQIAKENGIHLRSARVRARKEMR